MDNLKGRIGLIALVAAMLGTTTTAYAQSVIRIGIVGPMTGPFANMGQQWRQGIEAYMAVHGDTVDGHRIEVIYRDTTGNPANARQLTQELVVRDRVSFLGGYGLSPEAYAAAPVVNEVQVPTFLFHVASPGLVEASPYYVIMGQNITTAGEVAAHWSLGQGASRGYIAVADYAPGHDVANGFREYFNAHGGTVVGEVAVPLNTVDFAPIAERIAEAGADVVQLFIPPGAPAVGMAQALAARGVMTSAVVIGQGEAEDSDMHLFDDSILNFHSAIYYSTTLDNPANQTFLDAVASVGGPGTLPSTFTLGAYDAMHLIYRAIGSMDGDAIDGDAVMASLVDYTYTSPRGEVTINAQRQPVQDYVIRQVQGVGDAMTNVVIDTVAGVDPETFSDR